MLRSREVDARHAGEARNAKLTFTLSALYLAGVGLALMFFPLQFGRGAVPTDAAPELLSLLRLLGGPFLGISVLNCDLSGAGIASDTHALPDQRPTSRADLSSGLHCLKTPSGTSIRAGPTSRQAAQGPWQARSRKREIDRLRGAQDLFRRREPADPA
jgi:hypothetical protein